MSITPVSTPPVPVAPSGAAGEVSAAAADFAALVQGHLSGGSGGSSDGASAGSSGALTATEAAVLEAASAASVVPSDGLAALLAGLVARPGNDAALTAVAGGPAASGTSGTGTVAGVAAGLSTASASAGSDLAAATDGDGLTTAAAPFGDRAAAGTATAPAATGSADGSAAGATGAAVNATVDPAARFGAGTLPSPAAGDSTGPGAVVAGAAGLGGVGAAAGTGPASASPAERGPWVTGQVFPEVTRLVARGDGTHRLTLRLHPADLGEVKVILTVKDNTVDVTLSAGPAAREALREGSPQLRALLELAGATTGQLVVRDLAPLTGAANGLPSGPSTATPDTDLTGGDPRSEQDLGDGSSGARRDPDGGRGPSGAAPTPTRRIFDPAGLSNPDSRLDLDL
jgi:flagellar hook-length control protein FliK